MHAASLFRARKEDEFALYLQVGGRCSVAQRRLSSWQ